MQNISKENLVYVFAKLEKAIKSFDDAISNYDGIDDVYRDGIIQRFEYCVEICRKCIKSYMEYESILCESVSPKFIIKIAHKYKIIENLDIRIDFLDSRNKLSHLYNEIESQNIFEFIQENQFVFDKLKSNLENLILSK